MAIVRLWRLHTTFTEGAGSECQVLCMILDPGKNGQPTAPVMVDKVLTVQGVTGGDNQCM
jgi:pentose-5-phosphate-3-epimerase